MKTEYFVQVVALSSLWSASFLSIRIPSPVFGPNLLTLAQVSMATFTPALLTRLMRQPWADSTFFAICLGQAAPATLAQPY